MVDVLFEDNHLIAVRKPAGLLCQSDITGDDDLHGLVKEYIRVKYEKPGNVYLGMLHRIDRPVSGVVLFAKTSKAAARMTAMFQSREIQKYYHAVTIRQPDQPSGRLVHYLEQLEGDKIIVRAHKVPGRGKQSSLIYETMAAKDGMALLQVELETGRKHQIRVQLASAGSPVVGDLKYGAPKPLPDQSIALHAYSLRFLHPVTKQQVWIKAAHPAIWPWTSFELDA